MSIVSLSSASNSTSGAATAAPKAALEMAAEQFEAMFLQQVLKQMRRASDVLGADSPLHSREQETFRDFYDGALADNLATKRQTGIADMLVKQLGGQGQATADQAQAEAQARSASLPERASMALTNLRTNWQAPAPLGQLWEQGSSAFKSLVQSVIRQESGGKLDAVSPRGALGLMQLMPDTAREMAQELGEDFSLSRLTRDGAYNQRLGSAYLHKMLNRYDGDQALALAAYNAGPGRVDSWLARHGDPRQGEISHSDWVRKIPLQETRDYTRNILADMASEPVTDALQGFNKSTSAVASTTGVAKGVGLLAEGQSNYLTWAPMTLD